MEPDAIYKWLGGAGNRPKQFGRYHGYLLILGSGRTVWEDYAKVRPWKGDIMCLNDIGMHIHDRIVHWASLHGEYFKGWAYYREHHNYGGRDHPLKHSHQDKDGVDVLWNVGNVGGTSGLFACYVGLMLGYSTIALAGVNMTGDGHYFDPPWYRTEFEDRANQITWQQAAREVFDGRVKSMSGNTKKWLGEYVHTP